MDFSGSIINTFVDEAKELLAKMEEVLLKIEKGDQNPDLINDLFRSFHTLKGAAGMFSFNEISDFAHEIENLLATVRNNKTSLNNDKVSVLLEIVDFLAILLQSSITQSITADLLSNKSKLLNKLHSSNNVIMDHIPIVSIAPVEAVVSTINSSIKIDPNKLDEIINLIGEIVIAQEYLNNLVQTQNVDYITLLNHSEKLSKLIDSLKNLSLQLRMLPIKEIFSKFGRVVRDIATQQNKQIKLQIHGEDTELDKVIMEKINDPLLHLIRNACDHGIDLPEERVAIGKPICGLVQLQAYQENGEVVINAIDDGRGIDLDQVKQKAIKLGLASHDLMLSEQEILSYIFEPGFSTSEQVTNISGRGVGMDVVKKEIEKLHGSIHIKTKKMQGTTISIRLPLSLAIIEGLLIKIANFLCIAPLWNVVECVEIGNNDYNTIKRQNYFNFRNKIIPVIILDDLWDIQNPSKKPNVLIIVQYTEYKIGILVSQLQGEVQTVIKPMPEILNKLPWINGTAILGGGDVAVILDIPGLVADVMAKHKHLAGVLI